MTRKLVWIIDDDEEMARAIGLMLKMLDCKARAFLSARAGVQALIAEGRPDLLILDIFMPEITGLDMLEFLRRNEDWKDLPIVMLTTESSDVMIDKAMEIGADAYVTKPVSFEELEASILKAFSAHSKQQGTEVEN